MKIKIKKFTPVLYLLVLFVCVFIKTKTAGAWLILPTADKFNLQDIMGATGVEKFIHGVDIIYEYLRYVIGSIAITFLVYSGFMLITARGEEEEATKQKNNLLWGLIGLSVISLAEFARDIFNFQEGGFMVKPTNIVTRSTLFNDTVLIVIRYIKYVIGAVAVAYIVRSAIKLITAGYSEDVIGKEKKNILAGFIGLTCILLADVVVNDVLYKVDKNHMAAGVKISLDAGAGVKEIIGITSFLVNFAGPVAILGIMWGTIYYVISLGEDEKMKKALDIIKYSAIGLVCIYGAFAIVSTFIGGSVDFVAQPS